jgi:dihydrofolate reductase
MAKLVYVVNVSLDGYVEDANGDFEWAEPHDDVFDFIADLISPVSTYLYGRRMYETMALWELEPGLASRSPSWARFADMWRRASKVVYSRSLTTLSTSNSTLRRDFDVDAVRRLKSGATSDLTIGGSTLAAMALEAGVVDECQLIVHPVILGGGKPAFQNGHLTRLELRDHHRFHGGVIYLRYGVVAGRDRGD